MPTLKTIDASTILDIPMGFAVCPYCGGQLYARFNAWEEVVIAGEERKTNTEWRATEVELDCDTEPDDIDSDEWDEWIESHTVMPYVFMLPVCQKVLEWVNKQYRFDLDGDD